jgi:hypothetical protein
VLDRYTGTYIREAKPLSITRDGSQLILRLEGVRFVMFAESPTRFFAKTTDVQCEFEPNAQGEIDKVIISVGEGATAAPRQK